jgi:hypothetical protein
MRLRDLLATMRHGLLLAVLLCILLARAAVPAGWMPMAAPGGGIVLAPCSGMGLATLPAAHDMAAMDMPSMAAHATAAASGEGDKHHPDPSGDHPCSGAGVSVALEQPLFQLVAAPTAMPAAVPLSHSGTAIGRGLAAPPPPSTGPPILV